MIFTNINVEKNLSLCNLLLFSNQTIAPCKHIKCNGVERFELMCDLCAIFSSILVHFLSVCSALHTPLCSSVLVSIFNAERTYFSICLLQEQLWARNRSVGAHLYEDLRIDCSRTNRAKQCQKLCHIRILMRGPH